MGKQSLPCDQLTVGVCGDQCDTCYPRSFAAYDDAYKLSTWSASNDKQPYGLALNADYKAWFDCAICQHSFSRKLSEVARGNWCPYCARKKLCDDETCEHCFDRSLASYDQEKIFWWSSNNSLSPRQVMRSSNMFVFFDCWKCGHEFDISANALVNMSNWCGYCSKKLCDEDDCQSCFIASFAAYDAAKVACWNTIKNGCDPRDVRRSTRDEFWFTCDKCLHEFKGKLDKITCAGQWCQFCTRLRICGKQECHFCKLPCVICIQADIKTVGQRMTEDGMMCGKCFKASPHCSKTSRAQISMEIHTIHFLQEQCDQIENGYLFREMTTWDCAVLPGE